jgi:hypothetical protein
MTHHAKPDENLFIETSRGWGDFLCLWRLCPRAACTRAHACKGDVRDCFPRHFALLPERVQEWWLGIGEAQKNGLSFDEAMGALEAEGCGAALRNWHEAVEQSLAKSPVTQH